MGSVIGAAYASGMSVAEMEEFMMNMKSFKVVDFNPFTPLFSGFLKGKRIEKMFDAQFKGKNVKDLDIVYRPVAFDMLSGKEFHFDEDDDLVSKGVRSSISIPGVFQPVKYKEKMLIDGGVVNLVPVDVVKSLGADVVIAVDVMGGYRYDPYAKNNIMLLFNNVYEKMIADKEDTRIKYEDVRIITGKTGNTKNIRSYNFTVKKRKTLIENGRKETIKKMPEILSVIDAKIKHSQKIK